MIAWTRCDRPIRASRPARASPPRPTHRAVLHARRRADVAPRTVWFVLHGYGQLAGEFIRFFADLATDDSLVVAPEAMNRFYLVNPESAPARDRPVGATWMTREDRESRDRRLRRVSRRAVRRRDAARPDRRRLGQRHRLLAGSGDGDAVGRPRPRTARRGSCCGAGSMPPETDLSRGPPRFATRRSRSCSGRAITTSTRRWSRPSDVALSDGRHSVRSHPFRRRTRLEPRRCSAQLRRRRDALAISVAFDR